MNDKTNEKGGWMAFPCLSFPRIIYLPRSGPFLQILVPCLERASKQQIKSVLKFKKTWRSKRNYVQRGMVVHICPPSTSETEAGG
jgi:hypothetical protein